MKRNTTAAPPIEAPAIPPGLRAAEEGDEVGDEEEVCAFPVEVVQVEVDDEVDEDDWEEVVDVEDGAEVEDCVGTGPVLIPLGPRSEYTAQSGLGSARGQLGSWHREYRFVPTGGEQRTL